MLSYKTGIGDKMYKCVCQIDVNGEQAHKLSKERGEGEKECELNYKVYRWQDIWAKLSMGALCPSQNHSF